MTTLATTLSSKIRELISVYIGLFKKLKGPVIIKGRVWKNYKSSITPPSLGQFNHRTLGQIYSGEAVLLHSVILPVSVLQIKKMSFFELVGQALTVYLLIRLCLYLSKAKPFAVLNFSVSVE